MRAMMQCPRMSQAKPMTCVLSTRSQTLDTLQGRLRVLLQLYTVFNFFLIRVDHRPGPTGKTRGCAE